MSIREEIAALGRSTTDLRKFGLTVGTVFLLIGAFLWWREVSWANIPLILGGALFVLGAILPRVLLPVYIGWMTLAVMLGFVMTRVILTIFFFLVLTPVGLFFKLIGRDAMHRKLDRDASTYWIEKKYLIPDRTRMEKFF